VAELDGRLPRGVRFVGSHPLAGSENSGASWSDEDLLDGRVVVLTPTPKTRREDVETLTRFWNGLGAKVLRMSPAEHDRALAATSHLPHFVAAALAATTRQRDFALVAGGWLDTTRVAAGDPDLWRSIFATNRANTLKALARFEKTLSMLRDALQSGDDQALVKILATGKRNRDAVGS
jgi:prephenate dehydrogenase